MSSPLLAARGVSVRFAARGGLWGRGGTIHAVEAVDLEIHRGETLAIVGESGSGKTTLGRALLGLVKPHAGTIHFDGQEIAGLSRRALRPLRRRMQPIFQNAHASLDPRFTIGQSLAEPLAIHRIGTRETRGAQVAELLGRVGLEPELASRLPQELSGGQRQRVGIARALAVGPELVVADEPISALDASVQAQILNLLAALQAELGLTYLLISHDLGAVRYLADRVAVMYLGRIVETAPAEELFTQPRHPYTQALLAAAPRFGAPAAKPIQGEPPSALAPPPGCAFAPRCPHAFERCRRELPRLEGEAHPLACFLPKPDAKESAA